MRPPSSMPSIALEIPYFSKDCHIYSFVCTVALADVRICSKIFLETFHLSLDFVLLFASYLESSEQNSWVY